MNETRANAASLRHPFTCSTEQAVSFEFDEMRV
jgi:hypothetical protein